MQAVALVTGDEFLVPYNLTIGIGDVLDYMWKLHISWTNFGLDFGFTKYAHFDDNYGIDFAVIASSTGHCYNFNMIDAYELFNLES